MKKIVIGQVGGPTSVINTTLSGFVKSTKDDHELIYIENGYEGLFYGRFIKGEEKLNKWIIDNERVPGACLGSGRFSLSERSIETCVEQLKSINADTLVVIGGNGTMKALNKIEEKSTEIGFQIQVIGLPKTVDNDLGGTDHAPGFGSAAKYVAQTTLDISRDLRSMKNFEKVRILETMGRNSGWLALASGFLRRYKEDGPHLILIPERKITKEKLIERVKEIIEHYGYAIIVVSEGVELETSGQIEKEVVNGRKILGGISSAIADLLKKELKVMVRAELMGMSQRSSSTFISEVDYKEAKEVGIYGAQCVLEGRSKIMVSLQRTKQLDYNIIKIPVDLKEVVKEGERNVPDYFIDDYEQYYEWLKPFIDINSYHYPSPIARRDNNVKEPF